jgi:hypothetical protein
VVDGDVIALLWRDILVSIDLCVMILGASLIVLAGTLLCMPWKKMATLRAMITTPA